MDKKQSSESKRSRHKKADGKSIPKAMKHILNETGRGKS